MPETRRKMDATAGGVTKPPTQDLMGSEMEELDPYYYARDHEQGPGSWCVRGPNKFEFTIPKLDKGIAYIIGKLLSGKWEDAKSMLDSLVRLKSNQ